MIPNSFVSRFSAWAERSGCPTSTRRKLSPAIRKLPSLLAKHDSHWTAVIRSGRFDAEVVTSASNASTWISTSRRKVRIGAIGPAWPRVRGISSDESVDDVLDDFIFAAGQYAVRSRLVSAVGSLCLTYGVTFDFRAADLQKRLILATPGGESLAVAALKPKRPSGTGRRTRELTHWMQRLNTQDPLVHRAIFLYWRARCLWAHEFEEDAATALDSIAAVVSEALVKLTRARPPATRADLALALGLSRSDSKALCNLYELRCSFGAHPPASKWWDFGEIYADEVEGYFGLAARLIAKLSDLETQHRRIQPTAHSWSSWFVANCELLFDAVWFDKLPFTAA